MAWLDRLMSIEPAAAATLAPASSANTIKRIKILQENRASPPQGRENIPSFGACRRRSEIPAVADRKEAAPGPLFDLCRACRTAARVGALGPGLELERHAVSPPVTQAGRGGNALQGRAVVVALLIPEDRAVQRPALGERRAAGQAGRVTAVVEAGDPAHRNDANVALREQADPDDLAGVRVDVAAPGHAP